MHAIVGLLGKLYVNSGVLGGGKSDEAIVRVFYWKRGVVAKACTKVL